MNQKRHVTVLDFDHTYDSQPFLHNNEYDWIDFTRLRGTKKYCEEYSLSTIYEKIRKKENNGITFIGSGDYHYVTYLLLSNVRVPFTLVLFDHHTDLLKSPLSDFITCGSWGLHAIEQLKLLKKVIIIGVNPELIKTIPPHVAHKVTIFPNTPFSLNKKIIYKQILQQIPTRTVYISIDKDVLNRNDAITNWDQGDLHLSFLNETIQLISNYKTIEGVDICGESPPSHTQSFSVNGNNPHEINSKTNKQILDGLLSIMDKNSFTPNQVDYH
ncbi:MULTISPECIES: arginase family protein [Bacillaceae]|uniref:Arginase family protein n=1 Tax=Evansella alkalicola TaxID=745819 RepID=A0ABS6JWU2_9BACI|nr:MULTISPECIES: arginase family protein [Bacillaceae]MBU9722860.1 arginase family protein [Bacillus alkalicola]